jgi:hypothetical protein
MAQGEVINQGIRGSEHSRGLLRSARYYMYRGKHALTTFSGRLNPIDIAKLYISPGEQHFVHDRVWQRNLLLRSKTSDLWVYGEVISKGSYDIPVEVGVIEIGG